MTGGKHSISSLAVYSTIYPGVEPFLRDWYDSIRNQTDRDFDLWVGLDSVSIESACEAMGGTPVVKWVTAAAGDTPAQVRQKAFEVIVMSCDAVVMVDSDDILHPSRVESAREALQTSHLAGCALRLVDRNRADLGLTFGFPAELEPDYVFPRYNIFGLSNSAYRTDLLRRCLPIPPEAILVDWFLATTAWLLGAGLNFDNKVRMDYRQHGANMTQVRPPFTEKQVSRDAERVLRHFKIISSSIRNGTIKERLNELETVAEDIDTFYRKVVLNPERLGSYVEAINRLDPAPLWWASVAHPALHNIWS